LPHTASIAPEMVRFHLLARHEIALIDLREEADFARGHPLFAAQLSVGQLETTVLDRIPRSDTLIVLYDNGEGLVEPAANKLRLLGYTNVMALHGGLCGWLAAGYELFEDVNSYSKAFGELVEVSRHTPSLSAPEVQELIASHADVAVLDVRRFDEYATMSIPTGTSVPGAELALRARVAAPDPKTTIIINCAGRTRSIIGAQSLVNVGMPNPVFALRNGTIGWTLAGQALDAGQSRSAQSGDEAQASEARTRARAVSYRAGVRHIGLSELDRLAGEETRTLYRFDVRLPEAYLVGHIEGFRNAPGGQLVQETDMFAPVRGARIVLADDLGSRADMTASWLAQMGWEVLVLDDWPAERLVTGHWTPALPSRPQVSFIEVSQLAALLDNPATVLLDLAPSRQYNSGHIPGARFVIRSQLSGGSCAGLGEILLTSPDGILAEFAAGDLAAFGAVRVLRGGTSAWVNAGLALERPSQPARGDVYKRPYEGTDNAADAMQAYLDWEAGLVEQLEKDGTHGFFVI
jgi:rhodanese-related sulfurtransferase